MKDCSFFECSDSRSEAIKIEKFIKNQKSRKLIEKMIRRNELYGQLSKLVIVPLKHKEPKGHRFIRISYGKGDVIK